ncbi:short-chain dehydrogenase [Cryobacterium roopkundense]|uniref:NAD(P)-dependent dehydrogenase (Short-subunit alcohol dehydrogenase family) n=1 Tax=Cryobacterium roopkundense TaxID=1001240 RepID=A0A099JUJ1_9MICO|nr:SDR family NAD(P)-dependent oxidoreductase [Cryobacterium roopkundense]KGJ81760.1 short-chain dehydrogenase [Cryobacterium roopkundense]MBB5642434.1 NAD(P)-dependent dehydrogenase (short-subunit alcohol dehydrogenase family) [Cryobacterium roopkundense]
MTSAPNFPADRTVVLTGAASERGIGRSTADKLASLGWSVAIVDIDADAARTAASAIESARGIRAIGVGADVSDKASVDAAIGEIEATMPPIVGLVNLAGISSPTEFMSETVEAWDRVFAINMRGSFLVSQRVLGGMIDRKLGRIVSISSVSAQRGGGTYSKVAYSASKAAIIGFTRALAREMGEHNITVNAVAPGPIDTDIMGGTLTDERKSEMSADILMGRVGTRDDVAALISFLLSADAGYITAATYDINGGLQVS